MKRAGIDVIRVRYVCVDERGAGFVSDEGHGLLAALRVDVRDDDGCALPGHGKRGCPADAVGGAGYEGNLVLELAGHGFSPWLLVDYIVSGKVWASGAGRMGYLPWRM